MPAYRKASTNSYGYQSPYYRKDETTPQAIETKLDRYLRLCQVLTKLPNLLAFSDCKEMFPYDPSLKSPPMEHICMVATLLDIAQGVPQETSFRIHGITPAKIDEFKKKADVGDPFCGKFFDFLEQAPYVAERAAISAMRIYFDSRSALEWLRANRPGWNRHSSSGPAYDPLQHATEEQLVKELQELGNVGVTAES